MPRAPSIEQQIAAVRATDLADPTSLAKLHTALESSVVAADKLAEPRLKAQQDAVACRELAPMV